MVGMGIPPAAENSKERVMNFDILYESIMAGKLLTEALVGEWWITNHGQAIFADGDVSDQNHASMIISELTNEIAEIFDVTADEGGYLESYVDQIKANLDLDATESEKFDADPANYIFNILKEDNPYPTEQQLQDAFFIAYGSSNRDPRDYGMRYLGYKRMAGRDIQTYTLTSNDLKIIADGINDAYGDDLNDRYSDDESEQPTFNIEVMSTRKWYQDIPLDAIEEGDPVKIAVGR